MTTGSATPRHGASASAAIPEADDTESNLVLTDQQRRDVIASRLCDLGCVWTLH